MKIDKCGAAYFEVQNKKNLFEPKIYNPEDSELV